MKKNIAKWKTVQFFNKDLNILSIYISNNKYSKYNRTKTHNAEKVDNSTLKMREFTFLSIISRMSRQKISMDIGRYEHANN